MALGVAWPASAHVTVSSPDAAPGGFGKVVFRVPTESDTASTTKLTVTLPASTPFAFVSTEVKPGWVVTTTERKLSKPLKAEGFTVTKAVSQVTWTAAPGRGIKPGQFDEFALSVGPFAKTSGVVSMPARQTYSDGSVVAWDQPTPKSGKEPEHPAPTLKVTGPATATVAAGGSAVDSSDSTARWLGGVGFVLGLSALVVAVSGRRRGRTTG
jgi:uncharacterized protein YcnI